MNDRIKRILGNLGVGKIYSLFLSLFDKCTSTIVDCSIGDILLQRDLPYNNQLLLTSRLMDVEAYLDNADETFLYQNTISRAAYGEKHNENGGNVSFKNLIESYKMNGYKSDSFVTCDSSIELMDGNHRMALHIYEKIEHVTAKIVKRKIPFPYSSDGYYLANLPSSFIETLYQRYKEIQKWLVNNGLTFCAYLKVNNINAKNDLLTDMNHLCTVLSVKSIDDGLGGVIILFSMFNPDYVTKCNQLFSKRAAMIENILLRRAAKEDIIIVSKNCLEGHSLYLKYS